jgi:flagellar biosynthesis protein FlhG
MNDQAKKLRELVDANKKNQKVIAVSSGKGGVGKTSIISNMAVALSNINKKVILLDGDLGLANVDIVLGVKTNYSIVDVINKSKNLEDIIVDYNQNMKIIPAGSGIEDISNVSENDLIDLLEKLNELSSQTDVLLIDTGAGISKKVMTLLKNAMDIVIVATPEPTSIADAYATIKILTLNYNRKDIKMFINMVKDKQEAQNVFNNMNNICEKFLNTKLEMASYSVFDKTLPNSIKSQKPIIQYYPDSSFSVSIKRLINYFFSQNIKLIDNPIKKFFNNLFGRV